MAFVDVGSLDDLDIGHPTIVRIGRREVVLVRWQDRVFALRNVCPHQGQSFAGGIIGSRIEGTGEVGEIMVRADAPVLTCPWHRWEFELETGRCSIDSRVRIAVYDASIDGGRVMVDLENRSRHARDGL